jgi:hypothetical protein
MGVKDSMLCFIVFFVLFPLLAVVGTYGGVATLVGNVESGGIIFAC